MLIEKSLSYDALETIKNKTGHDRKKAISALDYTLGEYTAQLAQIMKDRQERSPPLLCRNRSISWRGMNSRQRQGEQLVG